MSGELPPQRERLFPAAPGQCGSTHPAIDDATREMIQSLPESQRHENGRHRCASCAYEKGHKDGTGGRRRFDTIEEIEAYFAENPANMVGKQVGLRSSTGGSRNYAVCELVGFRLVEPVGWVAVVRHSQAIARRSLGVEVIDVAIDILNFKH